MQNVILDLETEMVERPNVYELPTSSDNLTWYARAVERMKTRPSTDPTSWHYQGAIHGFNPLNPYWNGVGQLPSQQEQDDYWRQCQHGSWYFLPWHRMYLAYFEQIVGAAIVELGGPADWALPFWNYSDSANPNALTIPSAFTTPADSSNPLWMPNRNDTLNPDYVTLEALNVEPYTGDGITRPLGFGGPETVFSHSGRTHGALERLPHDMVHVDIGGAMGNPQTAALDPIFWLHHANIDRLWQVWLNQGGRVNPTENNWTDFTFDFHDSQGQPTVMNVGDVQDTTQILRGYTYQGVPAALPAAPAPRLALAAAIPFEIVGAANAPLALGSAPQQMDLAVASSSRRAARGRSSAQASGVTYLHFENITGTGAPPVYDVYLNLPSGTAGDTG